MEVGGWIGPGLPRNFFLFGKSSQNSSKPVLIFLSSIPGAKTINVFRACLGAQLTICAQK